MRTPSTTWGALDLDRVLDVLDAGAVERGLGYSVEDRVQLLDLDPDRIRAICRGSGRLTYLVTLVLDPDGDPPDVEIRCTCPVGWDCKHGVAVLTTALGDLTEPVDAAPEQPVAPPDWRRLLGDPLDPVADPEPNPLALGFLVEDHLPTYWDPDPSPTIAVRPLRRGRSGRWIRSGAEWTDVLRTTGRDRSFAIEQLAALRALALSIGGRAGLAPTLRNADEALWTHLELATRSGVDLVDPSGRRQILVQEQKVRPHIDLGADPDGAVALTVQIPVEERLVDVVGLQPIGSPIHGFWQLEPDRIHLAPLERPLPPTLGRLVLQRVAVPATDVEEFLELHAPMLARYASIGSADRSVSLLVDEFRAIVLTIERLDLTSAVLRWSARYHRGDRTVDHALHVPAGTRRDAAAEIEAISALGLDQLPAPSLLGVDGRPRGVTVEGRDLIFVLNRIAPELEERGAIVETVDDLPPLRQAEGAPEIDLIVSERPDARDGSDWFDLRVTVTVDGEDVDFADLFAALHRGDELLFLPSGTWLELDRPDLLRLRDLIEEARGLADPTPDSTARVNRFQISWWDELARLGIISEQADSWRRNVAALGRLDAPEPVPVPAGLAADLRSYQQEGFDWLAFLHANRLGGILADDMGLGKTIQSLALCLHVKETRPDARFLVVAPTSVVGNWAREARAFAPDLRVRTVTATATRRGETLAELAADADVVITSYALLRLEIEAYEDLDWEVLLLDEAQFVKNHRGKTHRCVRRLRVPTKIALTGTPLENTLMDLWSLLSITAPGLFPDPDRFDATFRKPIEAGEAPERLAVLRRRIAPLMRRRTKDAVLSDLPPKIEQRIDIDLSPRHRRLYDRQLQRQRQKVLGLVDDVQRHRFEILRSLTLLRQLALDPALVEAGHEDIGSAKIERLLADLGQITAEGHRALVFSQFTRFLDRVEDRLLTAGIPHTRLDGRTPDREAVIERFKGGDAPVFLISLKAGGFGLNLTEADYCFVLDPWWNPAAETQAVDRAHRIGQEHPVVVYRYVSAGTIEEKVMDLKAGKSALFDRVVDADGTLSGALGADDLRGLLDLDP